MNKLDISNWKEFPLSELFDITGSTTTPKNDLLLSDDAPYPYITTASANNGVGGYSSVFTEHGNVITVDSAVAGTALFQKENFTASDHVEKLIPKFYMTPNIALFICSILNASAKIYGYAYNEKRSQKALKKETILLPVKSDETIDFEYMENYIDKCAVKAKENITRAQTIANKQTY